MHDSPTATAILLVRGELRTANQLTLAAWLQDQGHVEAAVGLYRAAAAALDTPLDVPMAK